MGVFREISLPFGGNEYVITPSNKLLRRIEMKGRREDQAFNLVAVFYRANISSGFYDLAFVLAELINSTGANITEDDALAELMGINDAAKLAEYVALICSLIMPEAKEAAEKKADGAETKAA